MTDENEKKAIEAGAPARPEKSSQTEAPPKTQSEPQSEAQYGAQSEIHSEPHLGSSGSSADGDAFRASSARAGLQQAGFGSRLIAYLLDLIIVSFLLVPLKLAFGVFWALFPLPVFGSWDVMDWLARTAMTVLYFGWFYKEKGASPGKMLLGIEVINRKGQRLSYGETFAREVIGKLISAAPLLLGYLIAAFRADGKALHDLLFDTRVVVQPPPNEPRSTRD